MDPSLFTYGVECATMGVQYFHRPEAGGSEMNSNKTVVRLGIDLGKNSFHPWGVNADDERVLKKKVSRSHLLHELRQLPPCRVGLEACGGAHYGARELR
jgi:hypothetical protein